MQAEISDEFDAIKDRGSGRRSERHVSVGRQRLK